MTGREATPKHEVRVREPGDTVGVFCRCGWESWAPSTRLAYDMGQEHLSSPASKATNRRTDMAP